MMRGFTFLGCLLLCAGCATSSRGFTMRDVLGVSISHFAEPLPTGSAPKIWVHNMDDSACHREEPWEAFSPASGGVGLRGFVPKSNPRRWESPTDALAFEVITNYLTQTRKGRVIEPHRHNYITETQASTQYKLDWTHENRTGTFLSGEDLCLLDMAKKRAADKVLAFQIIQVDSGFGLLLIHYRLSDVRTGVVDMSRTLRLRNDQVSDWSIESTRPQPRNKTP